MKSKRYLGPYHLKPLGVSTRRAETSEKHKIISRKNALIFNVVQAGPVSTTTISPPIFNPRVRIHDPVLVLTGLEDETMGIEVMLQMAGATAHELNQPLSGLLGSVNCSNIGRGRPIFHADTAAGNLP